MTQSFSGMNDLPASVVSSVSVGRAACLPCASRAQTICESPSRRDQSGPLRDRGNEREGEAERERERERERKGGREGWCYSTSHPPTAAGHLTLTPETLSVLRQNWQDLPPQRQPLSQPLSVRRTLPALRRTSSDTTHQCGREKIRDLQSESQAPVLLTLVRCLRVTIPCHGAKDSSYMGKRLEQQPMYPQYTYYYPHYLQTKVGYPQLITSVPLTSLPQPYPNPLPSSILLLPPPSLLLSSR
ncbi:unnamed protein product [Coregonus sp. 'balchen']|nr:unnamed protein product [Coregonus sp. 'balchen']